MRSGVTKIARLRAWTAQKPPSAISASTACSIGQIWRLGVSAASSSATADLSRFLSSMRSTAVSWVTGVVAR